MDLEFDGLPTNGLSADGLGQYVRLVANAIGITGDEAYVLQMEPPANAYLALERRIPRLAERDVALLWDERCGWAMVVETGGGAELVELAYLGVQVLPEPQAVAEFARRLLAGENVGESSAPQLRTAGAQDDLALRLTEYARLFWSTGSPA